MLKKMDTDESSELLKAKENSPVNELNLSFNDDFSNQEGEENFLNRKIESAEIVSNNDQSIENEIFSENADVNGNHELEPPDLFNVEDEFNVEDVIEEEDDEEGVSEENIPATDELNWDDFEIVDEIDSGEIAKNDEENNKIDSSECELQQISDDEQQEEPLQAFSISTSGDENILSCQNSLSPTIETQMVNVMHADEAKVVMNEDLNEKIEANSMETAAETLNSHEIQQEKIDNDKNSNIYSTENECKTVTSVVPVKKHQISFQTDSEMDSDVLEITVSRGEDLEMGYVDHFSNQNESKKDIKNIIKPEIKPILDEKKVSDDDVVIVEEFNKTISFDVGSAKRIEPLPDVALFVESLAQLEFDWKKYTCFYCNPCQAFVTDTAAWEDHVANPNHKKNNFRWKACHDMLEKETLSDMSKRQIDLEKCGEFIAGPEYVIEICGDNGQPRHWFCQLCNSVIHSFEFLLNHLSGFPHIDNFMEKIDPDLYTPPGRCSHEKLFENIRVVTESAEKRIVEEAKKFIRRKGIGKMKCYEGETYRDNWGEIDEAMIEMEEQVLAQEVQRFFSEEKNYGFKCEVKSSTLSVANNEYKKMDQKTKNLYIGLQYLLEIWTPSRRVVPVWYCILCDCLVNGWSTHCECVQHIAGYLKKHYKKYAFDCSVVEANDEEECRNNFVLAKTKILQLEEYSGRVNNVVQITKLSEFDSFVAINAIIAKQIVDHHKIRVGDPPRPKRPSTNKDDRRGREYQSSSNRSPRSVNPPAKKSPLVSSTKGTPKQTVTTSHKYVNVVKTVSTNGSPKKPVNVIVSKSATTNTQSSKIMTETKPARIASLSDSKYRESDKPPQKPPLVSKQYSLGKKRSASPVEGNRKNREPFGKGQSSPTKVARTEAKTAPITTTKEVNTCRPSTTRPVTIVKPPAQKLPATQSLNTAAKPTVSSVQKIVASTKPLTSNDASKKLVYVAASKTVSASKPLSSVAHQRLNSMTEIKRREPEKIMPRKRPTPRRSPPRRISMSPSSKRHRRESYLPRRHRTPERRHESPRRHRPQESERERYRRPLPLPPQPPSRRTVVEYSSRERKPIYETTSKRRERTRSRSRDAYRRVKEENDYRRERRYDERRPHDAYESERPPMNDVPRSGNKPNEPVVILSNDDLAKFTDLLRLVSVDLGRQINMGDLGYLRERLGSLIFDQCLATILNQSVSVPLYQHDPNMMIPPEMFNVQQQMPHSLDMEPHRRGRVSPPPTSSSRRPQDNHEYYRRRSQSPTRKQNRDVAARGNGTQRNRSPPRSLQPHADMSHHFQQMHTMPTQPTIINYYNGRNPQVSSSLSVPQQQQAMQNVVSNLLTSSSLYNVPVQLAHAQQPPAYMDPSFAYGNTNAPVWPPPNPNRPAQW